MSEVAVARNNPGVNDARQEWCIRTREHKVQEDIGGRGKDYESHGKGDAVDGEAAQPLLKVVAVRAKDEVLVAQEGYGNPDGRGDGERDVRDQGLAVVGKQVTKQKYERGVDRQRTYRVRHADHQEADSLAGRQSSADGGKWAVRPGVGRRSTRVQ